MPQELKSRIGIKVRFHECDPLQIVWHGNYMKYFEEGREEFGKKHGISYLDVKAKGFNMPVVKSSCDYKLPLKYGDNFTVESVFINSEAAKVIFGYKILKNDKIVCTGQTTQVFTDKNGELVLNNPSFFLDWKQKMGLL